VSLDWAVLDGLGRRHAFGKLADAFAAATEQERLVCGEQIESLAKAAATENWTRVGRDPEPMYVLAALACMPSAATATALLCRRELRDSWGRAAYDPDPVLRILRARQSPWMGELGLRLAERLPSSGAGWRLVSLLLREAGLAPPVTEGVTRGWLREMLRPVLYPRPAPLPVRLRDSPHLDLLLPAVFEFDGLGSDLAERSWDKENARPDPIPAFPIAVAELVSTGRLDRAWIIDATIGRLVRGDRPAWLRPFTVLHDLLALTPDEQAHHTLDYVRLLSGAPSPIAGVAQGVLRALDEAGRLGLPVLLEASRATLERPEKTLVKAQLGWLEKVARRDREQAGAIAETMAAAFAHPALDMQERALTLIGRQMPWVDAATTARLAGAAAGQLTGDLAARAAALFDGQPQPAPSTTPEPAPQPVPGAAEPEPAPQPAPGAAPQPAPPLPARVLTAPVQPAMPPPITDAAELAAEVVALLREPSGPRWERVLAATVMMHAAGRHEELAATLEPVLARHGRLSFISEQRPAAIGFLGPALRVAMRRHSDSYTWKCLVAFAQAARNDGTVLRGSADGVLALRVAEIAMNLADAPVPVLMSTPVRADGSLTADVLLERLRRAEAEGWQPWPLDFEQALLRLPRGTGEQTRARAARLTTGPGRQFADMLATGLPEPVSTRFEQRASPIPDHPGYGACPVARRVVANVRPGRAAGLFLETALFTLTRRPSPTYLDKDREFGPETDLLAITLPHHREVVAAWALPGLAQLADQDARGGAELLPMLAEGTGPFGPAMSLALAYAFGARHESDRVAAVDAFVALAGRGEPFAAAVGADLGDLCSDGMIKVSRVVPALGDAHQAGASAQVWQLLTAALPSLLAAAPRGLPDLLMLATRVAEAVAAEDDIHGLAEVAGRAGGTRLVQEARRLLRVLGR
jgi:hypothetical protein